MLITKVERLLEGRALVTVAPDVTVREACRRLDAAGVDAVAVCEDGALLGILCERDVIRRCICQEKATGSTEVREVMTPAPVTIGAAASLAEAVDVMKAHHFRHLPVVDAEGSLLGLITMRDIPTEYRLMVERFHEFRGDAPVG